MKKVILWFFLCCKRYLKRIPFLLLLAAPLVVLAGRGMKAGAKRGLPFFPFLTGGYLMGLMMGGALW